MQFFKISTVLIISSLLLTGCSHHSSSENIEQRYQEDILLKADNYSGLIKLYRERVSKDDTAENRIALAKYYYLARDYQSSLYYLKPLLASSDPQVSQWQAKNLLALGRYSEVLPVTDRMNQLAPNNPNGWNLKGIALALSGRYGEAEKAFDRSRLLFIDDQTVVNNLAMIDIVQQRYQKAISILLPLYLRGEKQDQLVHNLVLSLVKFGDRDTARTIINNENLSSHPEALMDSLLQVTQPGGAAS